MSKDRQEGLLTGTGCTPKKFFVRGRTKGACQWGLSAHFFWLPVCTTRDACLCDPTPGFFARLTRQRQQTFLYDADERGWCLLS